MTEGTAKEFSLDFVHSWLAWCEMAGVSEATGRRLRMNGNGPVITRLSARRIGVRHRHHLAWLNAREQRQDDAA
jgi:hypothetical protein